MKSFPDAFAKIFSQSVLPTGLTLPPFVKHTYENSICRIAVVYAPSMKKAMAPHSLSCLENPMDGGAWWATVHGVARSWTRQQLHFHFSLSCTGEGNGSPLQCSCLENPRDGGAWWAAVYGVAQSETTEATQQQQQHAPSKGFPNYPFKILLKKRQERHIKCQS